ncbi:hypothetical protein ACHFJ0_09065 [Paracoccus sp. NGMCC 1.201697]|uniref:PRTase-CE domain-containing protein n=1 Tax=Paracoccus broussonetiae subsp. drimophilus TaxID=3373869 RepID=A0ABW7LJ88_9RHOB
MKIDRLPNQISRNDFGLLLELTLRHPWLIRKSSAFYDLLSVCESEREASLVLDLVSRINFFTPNDQLDARRRICDKITKEWSLTQVETQIIAINDRELADSSSAYVQQMKGVFAETCGWKTPNFINGLGAAVERVADGKAIVVVDDFCGSGESVSGKVDWIKKKLDEQKKTCRIYVAVAAAMEQSKNAIEPLVDSYFAVTWLKRGISDYLSDPELTAAFTDMKRLESILHKRYGRKKLQDYSFGWRASEALYYSEGDNPPNNNFPLFWWPRLNTGPERDVLIPRI